MEEDEDLWKQTNDEIMRMQPPTKIEERQVKRRKTSELNFLVSESGGSDFFDIPAKPFSEECGFKSNKPQKSQFSFLDQQYTYDEAQRLRDDEENSSVISNDFTGM